MPTKKKKSAIKGSGELLREFIRTGALEFQPLLEKLTALNLNPDEIAKGKKDPRYFYNRCLRQEGEIVVSVQKWNKIHDQIHGTKSTPGVVKMFVPKK